MRSCDLSLYTVSVRALTRSKIKSAIKNVNKSCAVSGIPEKYTSLHHITATRANEADTNRNGDATLP
jgi:hypothetical protein